MMLLVVSILLPPGEILAAALAVESRELAVTLHAIIALVVLGIIDGLPTCELFGTIFAQVDRCVHAGPDLLHSLSV